MIGTRLTLRYYRSHPLDRANAGVTRAVIVVHGTNRNADDYFATMIAATRAVDGLEATVVLAPNFLTADDLPAADEAYWTSGGWKRGHLSLNSIEQVSSYAGVDRIVAALTDGTRFPDLQSVVVTGHSAGGQYVHRYAAGNRVEQTLPGIAVRYIVANPSSYLYLGPERAVSGTLDVFNLPDRSACPGYNSWHYGLEDLNEYMSAMPLEDIRTQLLTRDVVYLLGGADSLSSYLDTSCAAMLQGAYRYARGLTLYNYLEEFFPQHHHAVAVVEGVGHSSRDMYTSGVGLQTLFQWPVQLLASSGVRAERNAR
ncbi:MAG: alpha/beta hydrolase [Gemmatimonadota bacterium]|nr:MAG: alpha/beta hydrolase [Gemmatimonadota bacterium]